jgi:hypothetical protein
LRAARATAPSPPEARGAWPPRTANRRGRQIRASSVAVAPGPAGRAPADAGAMDAATDAGTCGGQGQTCCGNAKTCNGSLVCTAESICNPPGLGLSGSWQCTDATDCRGDSSAPRYDAKRPSLRVQPVADTRPSHGSAVPARRAREGETLPSADCDSPPKTLDFSQFHSGLRIAQLRRREEPLGHENANEADDWTGMDHRAWPTGGVRFDQR